MRILALDTALKACSAALYDSARGEPLAVASRAMARGHAEALPAMVDALLETSGLGYGDIDRICVTTGPGTFTGVRVGLAMARALAVALGIPALGMTTLTALAHTAFAAGARAPLCVLVDARREEVYAQTFAAAGQALDQARVSSLEDALAGLPAGRVWLAGSAAAAAAARRDDAVVVDVTAPDAAAMARHAAALDPARYPPEPFYLRPPDAKPQARQVALAPVRVDIVEADPGGGEILAAIHRQCCQPGWDAAAFETLIAQPGTVILIARDGPGDAGQPAGFIVARKAADEGEILTICVSPHRRRRGIAAALMSEASSRLAAAGAKRLFLEVSAANDAALRLYRRHGLEPVGERAGYYAGRQGRAGDAIIMRGAL